MLLLDDIILFRFFDSLDRLEGLLVIPFSCDLLESILVRYIRID